MKLHWECELPVFDLLKLIQEVRVHQRVAVSVEVQRLHRDPGGRSEGCRDRCIASSATGEPSHDFAWCSRNDASGRTHSSERPTTTAVGSPSFPRHRFGPSRRTRKWAEQPRARRAPSACSTVTQKSVNDSARLVSSGRYLSATSAPIGAAGCITGDDQLSLSACGSGSRILGLAQPRTCLNSPKVCLRSTAHECLHNRFADPWPPSRRYRYRGSSAAVQNWTGLPIGRSDFCTSRRNRSHGPERLTGPAHRLAACYI
jgi:hypothetical protein